MGNCLSPPASATATATGKLVAPRSAIHDTVCDVIGDTPIIKLQRIPSAKASINIFVKVGWWLVAPLDPPLPGLTMLTDPSGWYDHTSGYTSAMRWYQAMNPGGSVEDDGGHARD